MRTPILWAVMLSLSGCNTAPVLPPADDRIIEIVKTDLWSGGELRAVVRYAEAEEPPLVILLNGDTLTVTRVDDSTFAAALPVHTGQLAVRVEGTDLDPLERMVRLHGFLSGELGPQVGGAVVARVVPSGAVVLGTTLEGPAEVSLGNGQIIRTWPLAMQAPRCMGGIAPGPVAGHVMVRGGNETVFGCDFVRSRPYDAAGLGPATDVVIGEALGNGITAILGPLTAHIGSSNQAGFTCRYSATGVPWAGCELVDLNVYDVLVGYEAGYLAKRILPLARNTDLYNLETGEIVAPLPAPVQLWYTSAAFSASEDSLYAAAYWYRDLTLPMAGKIYLLDAATGAVLDEIEVFGGMPVAIALDDARDLILVAMRNREEERTWLRVLSRKDHSLVADLPVTNAELVDFDVVHEHYRLVQNRAENQVVLVGTERIRRLPAVASRPMLIARWTLPPQ